MIPGGAGAVSWIIDSHEDLAWNILQFGRDYTRPVAETRAKEAGSLTIEYNGNTLLGWPEYQEGKVVIVFATLFATPARRKKSWERVFYASYEEAYAIYHRQAALYQELCERHPDHFRLLVSRSQMEAHLQEWQIPSEKGHPVGLVLLMEGAEGIRHPHELGEWWELGLRQIGLAWAGTRYCGGTGDPGPLTDEGQELLRAMAEFPFALDLSHMDERAALQALDSYPGPILVSHANCAALLRDDTSNRHLSDLLIRRVIERGGVIGVVPYNRFLKRDWRSGDARLPLDALLAHIDHICQLAGDALHVGLGTDFDGGFGLESVPEGIESIADLQKIGAALAEKGYSPAAVEAILGENWRRHLSQVLIE
ncbi:MAG: membrane dipeptidase [Chloroflexi bacterium]|nr:membrane dipeptidase [Chloroflexota bacterium]